jgi:hypothetical protein
MQLLAHLQEFISEDRLSQAQLQEDHQPRAQSRFTPGANDAGHVPSLLRPLPWHFPCEFQALIFLISIDHLLFQFNTLTNALARCPHCRKVSSVGPDFARGRGILFAIVGLIFIALGIGVTVRLILWLVGCEFKVWCDFRLERIKWLGATVEFMLRMLVSTSFYFHIWVFSSGYNS